MLPRTCSLAHGDVRQALRGPVSWRRGFDTTDPSRRRGSRALAFGSRFRVVRLLGRGGMGSVHQVHDAELGRDVALKVVESLGPAALLELKTEFRRAATLLHPNVVQLYELFVANEQAWFTMELVAGRPFDLAVRDGAAGPLPERRFAAFGRMLAQAADGLIALHAGGIVHRDVKPSNVLVTPDGRVVLLDFGIAALLADTGASERVAGTLPFMPPEAFAGRAFPASDAWSLAVMAYEVLAGTPPFERPGAPEAAPPLRTFVPWLPAEVAGLLDRMLARDPQERPPLAALATAVRAALDLPRSEDEAPPRPVFVGRVAVLDRLRTLWSEARRGVPVVVDLEGPSGIGKSELVRRFCSDLSVEGAVVLLGRCHPHENVPFRAFDDALDQFAEQLDAEPADALEAYDPRDLADLLRVFPTFATVRAWSRVALPSAEPSDGPAMRASAFRTLRALMEQVSRRAGLLVAIDDFHWADLDSLALLEGVFAEPAPAALLLVSRTEDAGSDPVRALRAGRVGRALGPVASISLAPLTLDECRALVTNLGGDGAERLAAEAGGSPLYLQELLRAERAEPGATLESMILRRVSRLPPEERSLLTMACVAGQPMPLTWMFQAAGLPAGARDVADRLVRRALLRVSDAPGSRGVVAYHQRVADAVTEGLATDELRWLHGRLADVLAETAPAEAERRLLHLDAAGREREAADQAGIAARAAEARLAFHRAAELYSLALARGWAERPVETRRLLADALGNAGQAARAADVYRELVEEPDLDPDLRVVLRARAVGQDLNAGEVDRGRRELVPLLRGLGVGLPSNAPMALVWSLVFRLLLFFRGRTFTPVAEASVPAAARLKVDLLWVAAVALTPVDHLFADAAGARGAWEALRAGEPRRIARSLAYKAGADAFVLGRRGHDAALATLGEAEAIAQAHGTFADRNYCRGVAGTVHWARGEWSASVRELDLFLEEGRMLSDVMPGGPTSVYAFLYSALAHTGALGRLGAEVPRQLDRFDQTGDRLGRSACLLGQGSLAWLVLDRPQELEGRAAALLEEWGGGRFLTQHYHALITRAHLHLYRGEPIRALEVLDAGWDAFVRSRILTIEVVASEMWFLRGRVAAATVRVGGVDGNRARRVWALARRRVAATRLPWSGALERVLDGALAEERDVLLAAADAAERVGLPHLAAANRWRAGDPRGVAWMAGQGAVRPEALAAAFS